MQISRRAFSQGIGGLFGAKLLPGGRAVAAIMPVEAGVNDAYAKLLGEYIRVEEAAIAAGRSTTGQIGAATWEGRQLESFIAELDGRVDLQTTARQIYSDFKARFRAETEKVRARAGSGLTADRDATVDPIADAPQPTEGAANGPDDAVVNTAAPDDAPAAFGATTDPGTRPDLDVPTSVEPASL